MGISAGPQEPARLPPPPPYDWANWAVRRSSYPMDATWGLFVAARRVRQPRLSETSYCGIYSNVQRLKESTSTELAKCVNGKKPGMLSWKLASLLVPSARPARSLTDIGGVGCDAGAIFGYWAPMAGTSLLRGT